MGCIGKLWSQMKLPNAHLATVPARKMTHYLLNPAHPAGGSKANFFLRFGFTVENWEHLAGALLQHARENEVIAIERTPYGVRYAVDRVARAGRDDFERAQCVIYSPQRRATTVRHCTSASETMNQVKELDPVALTCDLPKHGLKQGDVGTAVLVHGDGEAFEVEFVGYDGHTVALVTLERDQVRPLRGNDIPHARELASV